MEEREILVRRLIEEEGYTLQQVGDYIGISKQGVAAFCKKFDICTKPPGKDTEKWKNRIEQKYGDLIRPIFVDYTEKQIPLQEILEKYNLSRTTAINILAMNDVIMRGRDTALKVSKNIQKRRVVPADKNELYDLYVTKGLAATKISKIYKCSTTAVYYNLKKFGIMN